MPERIHMFTYALKYIERLKDFLSMRVCLLALENTYNMYVCSNIIPRYPLLENSDTNHYCRKSYKLLVNVRSIHSTSYFTIF